MAFSADELRVLRRALADALRPGQAAADTVLVPRPAERPAEHVQEYLRLAHAVDEAAAEAGRLRSFLLDELSRYRQALPGSSGGYLERLTSALAAGYVPGADDLAALRRLRAVPSGTPEYQRRTALLRRCEILAENDVRLRLEAHMTPSRRLLTLPGARSAMTADPVEGFAADPNGKPDGKPAPAPAPAPGPRQPAPAPVPDPAAPRRPPTPAEIWPPGRKPAAPERQPGEDARSA
jgi:hypothetical protein